MKIVSWNVNGIRACIKKGYYDFFAQTDADFFCIQETKMQAGQQEIITNGYVQFQNCAQRKGYSGVMVFAKQPPLSVFYGMGIEEHDREGRLLTLEYDSYYLLNCYTPNAKEQLARLTYRIAWEEAFRQYINGLTKRKAVILCGDLNVAHQKIDIKDAHRYHHHAGFSDAERAQFSKLLETGLVDTYRYVYPETVAYTWWDYRFFARQKNIGWRIDYVLVSESLKPNIQDAYIYGDVLGSDHCPIGLRIDV